jgi:phosphate:Na+ symporter
LFKFEVLNVSFDIWKSLAGVAIFLLGMKFLEDSLRQLAGRPFKLFLKKQTSNKLKAITGGAIVTTLLQSSSVVGLMVLAFVGAGVITMQNSLAVVLGANLGTTVSNWLVVLLGFNFNIESFAFPISAVGGIGYALFDNESRWKRWSGFLLGFGFLFVGLSFIKTGIEELVKTVDLEQFSDSPLIIFFGIGLLISSLIQSSSATIVIALSALYVKAISLPAAMAIALGAELGTTLKLLLASTKGNPAKKRVSLGNFLFNGTTVLLVLIFIYPLQQFINDVVGIKDNLIALVFFQTLVNVFGIVLFYPFLGIFGRFLESRFKDEDQETLFIHKVPPSEADMAIDAFEQENKHFIHTVVNFCLKCFDLDEAIENIREKKAKKRSLTEQYEFIKNLYGEMHTYTLRVQSSATGKDEMEKLDRLVSSARNTMYAAKSMKDAIPDIEQLRNSSNDVKHDFYLQTGKAVEKFCNRIENLLQKESLDPEIVIEIFESVPEEYNNSLKFLYRDKIAGHVTEIEITTLVNFNREIFSVFKSLMFGLKDLFLEKEQSKQLDELPGFIR